MHRQSLIQVGNRILNVQAIRHIEIETPQLVSVYLSEQEHPIQFSEREATALMAVLNAGYIYKVEFSEGGAR